METPTFRSVRTARISEQIVQQLQAAIFSGTFQPGDRLPSERDLSEQFEASRATVREALRALEMSGLIRVRPGAGGGAHVARPSFDLVSDALRTMLRANSFDLKDLYEARLLLEPGVAELAARVADDEAKHLLRGSLAEGQHLLSRGMNTAHASYNFHFLLARAARNNLVQMLMSSLIDLVHRSDQTSQAPSTISASVVKAHEEILHAIELGDGAEARRLTADHLVELFDRVYATTSRSGEAGGQVKEETVAR